VRIVHVVHSLDLGGQERLIMNLSRELQARGHEPVVVSLTSGGELAKEFGDIQIEEVPRAPGVALDLVPRLTRLFHELHPDAVHTHNPSPMLYGAPAAAAAGVPRRVHTKHGINVYGTGAGLMAARAVVRTLTALVAVSKETADVARRKERVPARLLHVIPNGIPLASFAPDEKTRLEVRSELGIPVGAFVVGTVGRLAPEKDYPLLVRAMTPLLGEEARLVIVGGGESRRDIERAAAPVSRFVTMTGPRHDVPRLLTAFDVFSLTSRTEGLPLVVPEAMASGLPVVATAVGGLPSVVPRSVGRLAPYGDAAALTALFSELRGDEPLRREMGRAARALALEQFSIGRMTDAYEALYRPS
jgi:sugar transferase (PEP-CTERM/EpsH1 system associated)